MKRALPCVLLVLGLLTGCASLPSLEGRPESTVLVVPGGSSPLADAVAKLAADHPGLTGAHPLRTGNDAFAARAALIAAARVSIDVQYYIWHDDLTGRLMFDALLRAADRGVRVRLLLDDNNTEGHDATARGARCAPERRGAAVQSVHAARGARRSATCPTSRA